MKSQLIRRLIIALVPVLVCMILFSDAIFTGKTLFHMDWAPYFPRSNWIGPWEHFVVKGNPFSMTHIMMACLPLRFFHVAFYFVCISGTVWALYGYLRDRALTVGAALLGGLAFGFSGYCVTLVSAGHRGIFEACLSAASLLFLGARAIHRGKWYYYALSALPIALVVGTQPDVFLVLLTVVGALLLVDLIHLLRSKAPGCGKRLSIGVLVFSLAFTISGWRGVQKIVTGYLPGREVLIEQSAGGTSADGEQRKWIFCTNWSLPPSDCVELAVPLVKGIESTDREVPFWGELGRSYGWEPGERGFPSYRQHTIYAGAVQLLLALYMMLVLIRVPMAVESRDRALLAVTAILVVITFVLALGRYTPFYRLFYMLPLANTIRCPVKFLHATNLAGAILCAYGAQLLVQRFAKREPNVRTSASFLQPEGVVLVSVCLLVIAFVVAKLVVGSGTQGLSAVWSGLGYSIQTQSVLLKRIQDSLDHAILVFCVAAIPFVSFLLKRAGIWVAWLPWGYGALLLIDMTAVNIHYVNTIDLTIHEMKNVIVEDIIRERPESPRVLDLLTGGNLHHPIRANFEGYYSKDIVLVDMEQSKNPEFMAAIQQGGDPMRQALADSGIVYIIAPSSAAGVLQRDGGYRAWAYYSFDGRRFVRSRNTGGSVIVLRKQQ
jgi:hypothetical protein